MHFNAQNIWNILLLNPDLSDWFSDAFTPVWKQVGSSSKQVRQLQMYISFGNMCNCQSAVFILLYFLLYHKNIPKFHSGVRYICHLCVLLYININRFYKRLGFFTVHGAVNFCLVLIPLRMFFSLSVFSLKFQ